MLRGARAPAVRGEVLSGGIEVIDHLAAEWRAICDEGPYDEPFYRPEWIAAYARAFAGDKTIVLVTARSGGQLVAVLPLVYEIGAVRGVPARKLRAAANVHTCRYDMVHRPRDADVAIPAIWHALHSMPGWDVIELCNVPRRGAAAPLARRARADGHATYVSRAVTTPYVALSDGEAAFDALLERLETKFRSNMRRRMHKLEARGPVTLVRARSANEYLGRFYALERAGWKGRERSAIVCNESTRRFYDAVARNGEQFGYLSLYALECGGRPVAMHYGLRHRGRYFLLKTAYDETLRDCSPGQLITHEVMRELAAERCVEFDFLGPLMDWKRDWAPRLRPHANWYVFRGSMGHVLHAVLGVRRVLGRTIRRLKTV